MKIKNKFKYIFVFVIVLVILFTFSINIFAIDFQSGYTNTKYHWQYTSSTSLYATSYTIYIVNVDQLIYNNNTYNYSAYRITLGFTYSPNSTSSRYGYCGIEYGNAYIDSDNDLIFGSQGTIKSSSTHYSSYTNFDIYVKYNNNSYYLVTRAATSPPNYTDNTLGTKLVFNQNSNYATGYDSFSDKGIYYIRSQATTQQSRSVAVSIYTDIYRASQPLTKTYNTGSFYNSGDEYNQIQVIGMSSDNSTFESITSIDYINTVTTTRDTVYSSSAWNGNYSSTLSYYYGDSAPNITSLNSDLNNLITFTTNVMASNLTLDFNTGQFYNNNGSYTSISVTGTTLNGSTFNSITSIAYKDTSQSIVDTAYNGGWNSGFSSQLSYYANQNTPTISSLNSACNNIITFTLYAIPVSYQNTFVTGNFINAGDIYNRIDIIGTSSDNSTFTTITSIDYVDTNTNARDTVYSNGTWNGNYNNTLLYYSTMSQPNISAVNNATNSIITFSVSLYSGSFEKTYNLTFYNNNNLYSSIKLIGTTSDNVKFNTINTIYYGNEPVYINDWEQGFSSVIVQYDFMNELDLSQINSDANSIIVFTKIHVDSVDPSIKNNMLEGVQVIFYPITSFIGLAQTSFPIAVILIMNVVGLVAVVIFSFVKRNKE